MKILVVEDDKKLGGFLRKGLEARGFVVDFCTNGDEGYTLATTRSDLLCGTSPYARTARFGTPWRVNRASHGRN